MARVIITITDEQNKKDTYIMDKSPILIGRGYANDIIISDPYVSAKHVIITETDGGWTIEDYASENGTYIGKQILNQQTATLTSGDVFTIGKTQIQLYAPDHPVEPAKKPIKAHKIIQFILNSNWFSSLVLTFFYAGAFWHIINSLFITKETIYKPIGIIAVLLILALFVTGFWSIISLLTKKEHNFHSNFSIIILFYLLNLIISRTSAYIGFITSNQVLNITFNIFISMFVFLFALFLHLSISTKLSKKAKYIIAGSLSVMLTLPVSIVSLDEVLDYHEVPVYSTDLFSPHMTFVIPRSKDKFLKNSAEKLFDN